MVDTSGPSSATGDGDDSAAPSAYAEALKERLKRVQAELESQSSHALSLRASVEAARKEAEAKNQELAKLRAKWAAEEPRREALLRETGDAEKKLAERERRCAELLKVHAAAELGPVGRNGQDGTGDEEQSTLPTVEEEAVATTRPPAKQLSAFRSRLAALEKDRVQLTQALQEARDATRQEAAAGAQLSQRCEAVRRETKSLKAATEAARENEARVRRKLEGLDSTVAASIGRQQAAERNVEDLRDEVQNLRSELSAALASSMAVGGPMQDEDATWAVNQQLQAKVNMLQEELRRKRERVQELRKNRAASTKWGREAASGALGVTSPMAQ